MCIFKKSALQKYIKVRSLKVVGKSVVASNLVVFNINTAFLVLHSRENKYLGQSTMTASHSIHFSEINPKIINVKRIIIIEKPF